MLGHAAAQTECPQDASYSYRVVVGQNYYDNDIAVGPGSPSSTCPGVLAYDEDATECEVRCNSAAECAGFVHIADNNCCYIKSRMVEHDDNEFCISHLKTGYAVVHLGYTVEYGKNYAFNDIYAPTDVPRCNVFATNESIGDYIARCDNDGPACVGFAYTADNSCCYRKSAMVESDSNSGVTSYRKI